MTPWIRCNGDHSALVGGGSCSCPFGKRLRRMTRENAELRADRDALLEAARLAEVALTPTEELIAQRALEAAINRPRGGEEGGG